MAAILLRVEPMTCEHCRAAVESALRAVAGVEHVSVDLETKVVAVQGGASVDTLVAAVEAADKHALQLQKIVLRVEAMMCGHCTSSVDRALRDVPGVASVHVDLNSKSAIIVGSAGVNLLIEAVRGTGKVAEIPTPVVLAVEGMMCGHCTASVEKALHEVPGVSHVTVSLERNQATIDGTASSDALTAAVRAAAYGVEALPPTSLRVEGMMCGHCTGSVEKAMREVPGVRAVVVNLEAKRAIAYGVVDPAALIAAVEPAGYTAELISGDGTAQGTVAAPLTAVSVGLGGVAGARTVPPLETSNSVKVTDKKTALPNVRPPVVRAPDAAFASGNGMLVSSAPLMQRVSELGVSVGLWTTEVGRIPR